MNWFVIRNGKEEGPFMAAQLRELVASQKLSRADQIRREDMKQPIVAEKVQGLFDQVTRLAAAAPKQAAPVEHAEESSLQSMDNEIE
jgi:hypothetical protein